MTKTLKNFMDEYGYHKPDYTRYDSLPLGTTLSMKAVILFMIEQQDFEMLFDLHWNTTDLPRFESLLDDKEFFRTCMDSIRAFEAYLLVRMNSKSRLYMGGYYHFAYQVMSYIIAGPNALESLLNTFDDGDYHHAICELLDWAADNEQRPLFEGLLLNSPRLSSPAWIQEKVVMKLIDIADLEHLVSLDRKKYFNRFSPFKLLQIAVNEDNLIVVDFFLKKPGFDSYIGHNSNHLLCAARRLKSTHLTNRLFECKQVRETRLGVNDSSPKPDRFYRNGLVRALWLELEKSPQFEQINSFEQLSSYAKNYLTQNTNWMHDDFKLTTYDLIASLQTQVLALRDYGFCDYVQISGEIPNPLSYQRFFEQKWLEGINKFISLPTNLVQFQERQQLRFLANRCLKQRRDEKMIQSETKQTQDNLGLNLK